MDDNEKILIQTIRQDAKDVKDCFTRFSFQALAFCSAVLGIIARYQGEFPHIALASIALIILLITVSRIGTYKYGSANRQFGYELHLSRTKNLPDSTGNGWKKSMREIGWEEAMRAWRLVQATVFYHLYYTHKLMPNFLRRKHHHENYMWFNQKVLAKSTAQYHAGSYLSAMNNVLHSFAILSTIPLFVAAYQFSSINILWWELEYAIPVVTLLFICFRMAKDSARRKILEYGLLSIHSCAIIWQAVVVAHYRAIRAAEQDNYYGYKHYTEYLAMQARDLADNIFNIHEWVSNWDTPTEISNVK